MSPMLRMQVFAISGTAIFSVLLFWLLWGKAPLLNLLFGSGAILAFTLWWGGSVAWIRLRKLLPEDTPDAWFANSIASFWVGNVATCTAFIFVNRYISDEVTMLCVLLTMMGNFYQAVATVRSPEFGKRGLAADLAPVAMPAFQIVFFAVMRDDFSYWFALDMLLIAFCVGAFLFRRMLQDLLNAAHAARAFAEQERDARTRFLASASHDLGQPLQSARLFFDQALRSPNEAARIKAGFDAKHALGAMDRLLHQMLDHLKLEAGTVVPVLKPVSAGPLIGQVVSQFDPVAGLAGVKLIGAPSSLVFSADPDLAARALGNLIDNALRHADARRVLVGARRRGNRVRLWVIDDGRGVAPEDRTRLFEEFAQGGKPGDRERGGFGLGLASVRRLCQMMGGTCGIDRTTRRGAAFFVEFSCESAVACTA